MKGDIEGRYIRDFNATHLIDSGARTIGSMMRDDLLGVARSSRIHEICGGE
jgi:hypothetical protein